jgi:hypothetical protein
MAKLILCIAKDEAHPQVWHTTHRPTMPISYKSDENHLVGRHLAIAHACAKIAVFREQCCLQSGSGVVDYKLCFSIFWRWPLVNCQKLIEFAPKSGAARGFPKTIWIFTDMMNETPGFQMPVLLAMGPEQMLERAKTNGVPRQN